MLKNNSLSRLKPLVISMRLTKLNHLNFSLVKVKIEKKVTKQNK